MMMTLKMTSFEESMRTKTMKLLNGKTTADNKIFLQKRFDVNKLYAIYNEDPIVVL